LPPIEEDQSVAAVAELSIACGEDSCEVHETHVLAGDLGPADLNVFVVETTLEMLSEGWTWDPGVRCWWCPTCKDSA